MNWKHFQRKDDLETKPVHLPCQTIENLYKKFAQNFTGTYLQHLQFAIGWNTQLFSYPSLPPRLNPTPLISKLSCWLAKAFRMDVTLLIGTFNEV